MRRIRRRRSWRISAVGPGFPVRLAWRKKQGLIRHGRRSELVRPLLHWRRLEIDAYIREHGLSFREDSSNRSHGPRRNRLRHEALPLLGEIFGRDVAPILARFGEQAARDDEALWSLTFPLFQRASARTAV